jgi:hypothetical protein
LARLLRAKVMACCFNASVAVSFDLDVRGASALFSVMPVSLAKWCCGNKL